MEAYMQGIESKLLEKYKQFLFNKSINNVGGGKTS
jgi:ribonucleotide reductase beta subunit family protein with ferritin-like domain